MDLKKKWQRFWTLRRHNDGGFTLVELIVVIAIMAILAGVGTTGYAGYIKNANKNSDRVLVGNVIRAIETGGNSAAFVSDESRVIGSISYPVGFVTLSTEGAQVLTSTTSNVAVDGSCNIQTLEIPVATSSAMSKTCPDCGASVAGTYYTVSTETVTFCTTHSAAPTECATDFSITHSENCGGASHSTTPTTTASAYADIERLYGNSGNGTCQFAANPGLAAGDISQDENGALYKAIVAAFGSVDNLKLKYDGWTSDEGVDFATFITGAGGEDGVMSEIQTLSNLLATISGIPVIGDYVDGDYADEEEVLIAVTNNVLNAHTTVDSWQSVWNDAANATWDSYGFGITGRENYSAARVAYNNGFATYLEANGIPSNYANVISGFNAQELMGYGLPGLVCTDAFTDPESPLRDSFEAAGDDGTVFEQCAELFEEYKNSTACQENAAVFYSTMETFRETQAIADDPNNFAEGNIFEYYNSYVDELTNLYTEAQRAAGDEGIMIIVSVANGQMQFSVSPSEASPRN